MEQPAKLRGIPQKRHPGRRGWSREVIEAAQQLYNDDPRPSWAQMARDLEEMGFKDGSPTESTLRDWAKRGTITEDSDDGPWLFTEDEPEDAALMLPVVRSYLSLQSGVLRSLQGVEIPVTLRMGQPTRRLARWFIRIRKLVPDIPVGTAWFLAHESQAHEYARARGLVTEAADPALIQSFLAVAPWRDGGALAREAVESGVLPGAIARLMDVDETAVETFAASVLDWEDKA